MATDDALSFFEELGERIDFCAGIDEQLRGVDLENKKVIVSSGAALSIEEAADHIAGVLKLDRVEVEQRIVNWLMMDYTPDGLTHEEMVAFEEKMEQWTAPYE